MQVLIHLAFFIPGKFEARVVNDEVSEVRENFALHL
jgi:hypothetical protein